MLASPAPAVSLCGYRPVLAANMRFQCLRCFSMRLPCACFLCLAVPVLMMFCLSSPCNLSCTTEEILFISMNCGSHFSFLFIYRTSVATFSFPVSLDLGSHFSSSFQSNPCWPRWLHSFSYSQVSGLSLSADGILLFKPSVAFTR